VIRARPLVWDSFHSATGGCPPSSPIEDTCQVGLALRRLGFLEVIERTDRSREDLTTEIKAFGDIASSADWAIIYYSGHGLEVDGVNYAKLARAEPVPEEGVALERLIAKVADAKNLGLIICVPGQSLFATSGRKTVGKAFAPIEPQKGVLVAFATPSWHDCL
jgi:Caspase domain